MYDLHNYSRYAPLYLFDMYELQEKDRDTWQFFTSRNVSMKLSKISLSAIGAAHALERENRKIKVLGCIKGIENNQAAQDQYFLIASEINAILDEFYCAFLLNFDDIKLQGHYQLIGSTNSRIKKMLNS